MLREAAGEHNLLVTLEENVRSRFGMPGPQGFRKALRLMREAEKFHRPVITFVDTPGAYPGKDAEENGYVLGASGYTYKTKKAKGEIIGEVWVTSIKKVLGGVWDDYE